MVVCRLWLRGVCSMLGLGLLRITIPVLGLFGSLSSCSSEDFVINSYMLAFEEASCIPVSTSPIPLWECDHKLHLGVVLRILTCSVDNATPVRQFSQVPTQATDGFRFTRDVR